jgi:hypothetical protein
MALQDILEELYMNHVVVGVPVPKVLEEMLDRVFWGLGAIPMVVTEGLGCRMATRLVVGLALP